MEEVSTPPLRRMTASCSSGLKPETVFTMIEEVSNSLMSDPGGLSDGLGEGSGDGLGEGSGDGLGSGDGEGSGFGEGDSLGISSANAVTVAGGPMKDASSDSKRISIR